MAEIGNRKRQGLLEMDRALRSWETRELAMVSVKTKMVSAAPAKAQKIECHDQKANRPPEPSIPMTAPDPATPAQIPTALLRWSFG